MKDIKSNKTFNPQIWSSFKSGNLVQSKFKGSQSLEFYRLNKYSKYLVSKNYNNIETKLDHIAKSSTGYSIYRYNSDGKWIVRINIKNTSQILVNKSKFT